jgi:hypothetical protein
MKLMIALLIRVATIAHAERPAEGIHDNSFSVEEAYSQEPSVVQHIFPAGGPFNLPVSKLLTDRWTAQFSGPELAHALAVAENNG